MFFRNIIIITLCAGVLNACSSRTSPSLFQDNGVKFYKGDAIKKLDCYQLAEQVLIVYGLVTGFEGRVKKVLAKKPVNQKKLKEEKKMARFLINIHKKSVKEHLKRCGQLSEVYLKFKRENPTPSIP